MIEKSKTALYKLLMTGTVVFLSILGYQAEAATAVTCSPSSPIVLNEANTQSNWVEIFAMQNVSLTGWQLGVSLNGGAASWTTLSGTMTAPQWLVTAKTLNSSNFQVALKKPDGTFADLLTVRNGTDCSATTRLWSSSGCENCMTGNASSIKNFFRLPDGTGPWRSAQSGNSDGLLRGTDSTSNMSALVTPPTGSNGLQSYWANTPDTSLYCSSKTITWPVSLVYMSTSLTPIAPPTGTYVIPALSPAISFNATATPTSGTATVSPSSMTWTGNTSTNVTTTAQNFTFTNVVGDSSGNFTVKFADPGASNYIYSTATVALPSCTGIHHYEITPSSWSGPSCNTFDVTVKACSDSAYPCTSPWTGGATGTLTATGTASSWTGGGAFTIPSGSSTITKTLSLASGSATLGITAGSPVPTGSPAVKCSGAGTCAITATDGGITISNGPSIGSRPESTTLTAVTSSGALGAVCTPLTSVTGQSVKIWATAASPATFTSRVSSGSNAKASTAGGPPEMALSTSGTWGDMPTSEPAAGNISLNFDSSGIATMATRWKDVGSFTMNAKLTKAASGNQQAVTLAGSSTFPVNPVGAKFVSSGLETSSSVQSACLGGQSSACDSSASSDTARGVAGKSFTAKAGAALWNADSETDFTDNPEPPAFNGNLSIVPVLNAPQGGNQGSLSPASVTASSGSYSGLFTWTEVGISSFQVSGTLNGSSFSGTGRPLGRFIPAYFSVTSRYIQWPWVTGVYMDQPFHAGMTITAMNQSGGSTTNYKNGFAKFNTGTNWGAGVTSSSAGSLTSAGNLTSRLSGPSSITTSGWVGGANILDGLFTFQSKTSGSRASPDGPFDDAKIFARPTDSDGVMSNAFDLAPDGSTFDALLLGSGKVRFGTLSVSGGIGSEAAPLGLPLTLKYWNGSGWSINTADTSSTLPLSIFSLSSLNGGLTSTWASSNPQTWSGTSLSFASGSASIKLGSPGVGNAGAGVLSWSNASIPWLGGQGSSSGFNNGASSKFLFGRTGGAGAGAIYMRDSFR